MSITLIADKNIEHIPTKNCRRCEKLGRPHVHVEDEFSLKTNGKRHTYCKKCRAEQTKEWTDAKKAERADYQRLHRANKRTGLFHGNAFKRRVTKPIVPLTLAPVFEESVEIKVENGNLVPTATFDNLYFAIKLSLIHI